MESSSASSSGCCVTRVVLWEEYADMEDGDVLVHVEMRPGPSSKWKSLAVARRCQRRFKLRLEALAHCGPKDLLRKTGVYFRKERRRKVVRLVEAMAKRKEGCCSVQVAAHVRGNLNIEVVATVKEFMDWLETLGMPAVSDAVEEYERAYLERVREQSEEDLSELIATLIGSAAQDVAFGPLKSTLKAAAVVRAEDDEDEETLNTGTSNEDVVRFGKRAYDRLKRRVFRSRNEETRTTEHDLLSSSSVLCRIATLVEEERLDLYDMFFDARGNKGGRADTHRISYADLRRGLARLLATLPCEDHTQYF